MTHSGQPKNPDGNPAHPWHTKLENWPANIPRITRPKEHFTSWRAKEQLVLLSIPSISIVFHWFQIVKNAIPIFSSGWVAIMNTRDNRFTHVEEQPKLVLTSSSMGANPIHIAWFAMHPNAYKPSIRQRFGSAPQGGACLVSSAGPALSDSSLPTLAAKKLKCGVTHVGATDAIDTVDGEHPAPVDLENIPWFARVLYFPGGCLGFLNHQQYLLIFFENSLHKSEGWETNMSIIWGKTRRRSKPSCSRISPSTLNSPGRSKRSSMAVTCLDSQMAWKNIQKFRRSQDVSCKKAYMITYQHQVAE